MFTGGGFRRATVVARTMVAAASLAASMTVILDASAALAAASPAANQSTTTVPAFNEPLSMQGVSCPSAQVCVAVGYSTSTTGAHVPIVENWNGTSWSVNVPFNPSAPPDLAPQAISCVSTTHCVAVGETYSSGSVSGLFAMTLKGTAWTRESLPLLSGVMNATLPSISCATTTDCTAVGSFTDGSGNYSPLIETLASGTWIQTSSTPPSGYDQAQFTAVSCATASSCVAVGFDWDTTVPQTHAIVATEASAYSITQLTDIAGATYEAFSAISCVDALDCIGTGTYNWTPTTSNDTGVGAFAATLASGSWTTTTIANPSITTSISNLLVQCRTMTSCQGVGNFTDYTNEPITGSATSEWVAVSFDGSNWTPTVLSPPSNFQLIEGTVQSMSCGSSTSCQAVGWDQGSPESFSLSASAGSWSTAQLMPGYSPPPIATLTSVSCLTVHGCVGVGSVLRDRLLASPMMAVRTNGAWGSSAPTLNSNETGQLLGVSCVSASFCAAVGRDVVGTLVSPLVAIYNGSAWSTTTINSPFWGTSGHLSAVSCASATYCVAVGTLDRATGSDPLVAALWNGVTWTSSLMPVLAGLGHQPHLAISCPAVAHCVAIASAQAAHANETAVETLTGKAWKAKALPQPAEPALMMNSISCVSATHCVAAGRISTRPVVDTLVGAVWTQTALNENSSVTPAVLTGVSCRSAISCMAVGTMRLLTGSTASFFAVLSKGVWSVSTTPSVIPPKGTSISLAAVSCAAATQCTAVGYQDNGVTRLPLSIDIAVR